MIEIFTAIIAFIVIIISLVTLHELGHYLTGRYFGLIPKSFSIGMGPEIYAIKDKHGTRWKLSAIPIGGYVQFAGKMHPSQNELIKEKYDFSSLERWKRACIIAAGPITNIIVAILILLGIALYQGKVEVNEYIYDVEKNSIANSIGIDKGDKITSWNDNPSNPTQMIRYIRMNPDKNINLTIKNNGIEKNHTIKIDRIIYNENTSNEYIAGDIGVIYEGKRVAIETLYDAYDVSVNETMRIMLLQLNSTYQMIIGERSLKEISGPIRIAKISGEQYSIGLIEFIHFAGILSIAIAFMNLLPIPGLDGGYLAIYISEYIKGSDLSQKSLLIATYTGVSIIGMFMLLAITNDIRMIIAN